VTRLAAFGALVLLLALALGPPRAVAGTAAADSAATPASAAAKSLPAPCSCPECHQFDFWLGDWEVTTPKGTMAGTNHIVPILGGCAIQENWKGSRGMSGTSVNMFVPETGMWHQTWIDDQGMLLLLDGKFEDGKMVLSGKTQDPAGAGGVVLQRITWSQLPGGKVRQLWETSKDGGKSWTVAFDGTYTRKS
jgi:hypothetical protein